jgi:uncharacterized protein
MPLKIPAGPLGAAACIAFAVAAFAPPASAQINSVPPSAAGAPLPLGTGPGVHSPNSPIAPLPDRADVLPWPLLTAVKSRTEKNRVLPLFQADQLALDGKVQRVQGFMMPLQPGERQRHFLVSAIPLTCAFCVPGGAESMVEVRTRQPVAYTQEPVVVEGRFSVLKDDPTGIFYRMTDAAAVK